MTDWHWLSPFLRYCESSAALSSVPRGQPFTLDHKKIFYFNQLIMKNMFANTMKNSKPYRALLTAGRLA